MLTYLKRKMLNVRDAFESLLLLLLMPIFGACLSWVILLWLLLYAMEHENETKNKPTLDKDRQLDYGDPCLCGFGHPCVFRDVDAINSGQDS